MNLAEFERELGRPLIGRAGFVGAVRDAIEERRPYAAGKIGFTEQAILHHPLVAAREGDSLRRRAFEVGLSERAAKLGGVFPADPGFLLGFAERMADDARELDCIGLFDETWEAELDLMRGHGIEADPVRWTDQEPDRGIPSDEARCYLPACRGKRVLLVCSFAKFLQDRANRETFEAVWAKTGRKWFEPASVEALSFPYGYNAGYGSGCETSLDLLAEIERGMAAREFDVALIAAGSLGIPVAAAAKRLGKVGISLGGALQVTFGVYGERWLAEPAWHRDFFNDAWTRIPEEQRPAGETHHEVNYW